MKKAFVINDLIQKTEDGKPFYYWGYASSGSWTTDIVNARYYESVEEVESALKDSEFDFGIYEVMTVYK